MAAALAHNVTYNMLLRARILSNYFRLGIPRGKDCSLFLECHKLMVVLTVAWQRDVVGKSQGSS